MPAALLKIGGKSFEARDVTLSDNADQPEDPDPSPPEDLPRNRAQRRKDEALARREQRRERGR